MPIKNPHPLYSTWAHMKHRAKKNGLPFKESWKSFKAFLSDVGDRPEPGMILVRKVPERGYTKRNLVWCYEAEKGTKRTGFKPIMKHPLYVTWRNMIGRCCATRGKMYNYYGKRGIHVCDRWRYDFWAFVYDMGPRPAGYTLDRIDNDSGYTPDNCRWASRKQQQRNRRVTRTVVVEGATYIASELAEHSGLKTDTIVERAKHGLSLSEVLDPKRRVFTEGLRLGGPANGARLRAKTHCKHGHSLSGDNLYVSAQGYRVCRACRRIRMQNRNK